MSSFPLTVYEFLVYIGSGAILLATLNVVGGYGWILAGEVNVLFAGLWLALAYVAGHVAAHISGYLLEELLVRRFFDTDNASSLFTEHPDGWRTTFFSSFFRPLPPSTRVRVVAEANRRGAEPSGRALYLHAFAVVKADAVASARMNAFQNQAGFCRNMALIAIVAAALVVLRPWLANAPLAPGYTGVSTLSVVGSLVLAILMFSRYLKFYRAYRSELFLTYAEAAPAAPRVSPPCP